MIKYFLKHQLGSMFTKYATLSFLETFKERRIIFKEGDELLIEVKPNEFQAYFILENGELIKSDIYRIKNEK